MKTLQSLLLTAAAVTLSLASCQKNQPVFVEEPALEGPTGVIAVNIRTATDNSTKSTVLSDQAIKTVQLFVFDGENLETSKYFANYDPSTTDLKITAKEGNGKTLYVVLNADRLKFSTKSCFENPSSQNAEHFAPLSKNTSSNLIMVGKQTVNVKEYDANKSKTDNSTADVYVKRLTAMIKLEKVTVDFRNTALETGTLKIQEIYLTNVVGYHPYGVKSIGDGTAERGMPALGNSTDNPRFNNLEYWYNKAMLQNSGYPAMTYDAISESQSGNGSVNGTGMTLGNIFLAYPNAATEYQSGNSLTGPVHTCLVIKALVSSGSNIDTPFTDKTTYYTFDLPELEPNKQYLIKNINITMLGADQPGERIVTGKMAPVIHVENWTDGNVDLNYDF